MRIIELIQDHQYIVLAITIPLLAYYGRVLFLALFASPTSKPATAPIRRVPSRPAPGALVKPPATPVPPTGKQEVLPSSIDQGVAGHQQRAVAKTVKIPVVPTKGTDGSAPTDIIQPARTVTPVPSVPKPASADEQAIDSMFGGVKADASPSGPPESKTGAIRRKASRMEELGFHHGIQTDAPQPAGEAPNPPKPLEAPRSQTAELTSILERIDKFLAEDQPAKPGTDKIEKPTVAGDAAPAKATAPAAPAAPAPAAAAAPSGDTAKPAAPAPTEKPAVAATPAAPIAKPDPNKKTQPLWARPDAMDEDADKGAADKKPEADKPGDAGGQQRLF